MKRIRGEILEIGVDWITAVSKTSDGQESLGALGVQLLSDERREGNDFTPWRFSGYEGFKCGSVQFGTRPDSSCLRLSSGLANEYWREVYHTCEKVTRVDLQVTVKTEWDVSKVIGVVHRCALRESAKHKDGPRVTIIRSNDKSATVYLGSRKSESFGRVYTKGVESGLDHYDGAVRFEVELKDAIALQVLRKVSGSGLEVIAIAGYVCGFLQKRGVYLEIPSVDKYTTRVPRKRPDVESRLRWIHSQVRPSVEILVHHGLLEEVLDCLGLSELVTAPEAR